MGEGRLIRIEFRMSGVRRAYEQPNSARQASAVRKEADSLTRPSLSERLLRASIALDPDPVSTWVRLRKLEGRRATVIDLYRLVSEPRGLEPHELPLEERKRLSRAIATVVWPGFQQTEGSERTDPIQVVAYGSMSVPGLAAKPIVDVQVSVADISDEDTYVPNLERLGIQLRSRDDLHRYFRPFPGRPRDVHVHVCLSGSEWEREHLLFRDYLRASPAAHEAYEEAKREASRVWMDDLWAYTDAKSEVILNIMEDAEPWAAETKWRP